MTRAKPSNRMAIAGKAVPTGYGQTPGGHHPHTHTHSHHVHQRSMGSAMPASPSATSLTNDARSNASRVFFADGWKYRTMSGGAPFVAPAPPPRSPKGTQPLKIEQNKPSPFTRGRSRVFYASEQLGKWDDLENDDGLVAPPRANHFDANQFPRRPIASSASFEGRSKVIDIVGSQSTTTAATVRGPTRDVTVGDVTPGRRTVPAVHAVTGNRSVTTGTGNGHVTFSNDTAIPESDVRPVGGRTVAAGSGMSTAGRASLKVASGYCSTHTTPPLSSNGSGHFRRSARQRGSSGQKSLDSGFSDSGGEVTSSGPEDVRLTMSPLTGSKPARHPHKWSPASLTIKSFLRPAASSQHGTTFPNKLSVLKCCMGRAGTNPAGLLAALSGSRPAVAESPTSEVPSETDAGKDVGKVESGTGTWPRQRRHHHPPSESSQSVVPSPTNSVPATASPDVRQQLSGKAYRSARCRGTPRMVMPDVAIRGELFPLAFSGRIIHSSTVVQNGSLAQWLREELPKSTEDECSNTLQNKSVARTRGEVIAMATRNSREVVLAIHSRANPIMADLAHLKKKLDKNRHQMAHGVCLRLSRNIHSLLCDCERHQTSNGHLVSQFHRLILSHLRNLVQLLARLHEGNPEVGDENTVMDIYCAVKSTFLNVTETLIVDHIKNVVEAVEEPLCLFSMKLVITSVSVLALQSNDLCRLISASGGIRALLAVCIDRKYRPVWATALRALATLCCVGESIREMEMSGGVECITDILSERNGSHGEKCEAAGVIAQITSPALENSHQIEGLQDNIPSLIQSLTDLGASTTSGDGFLLATAAIANLTFLADLTALLHHCRTVSVLVAACRQGCAKSESIFVKDQVATVLANVASHAVGRSDVLDSGGLVVLLCFLQTRPSVPGSLPEGAAAERVQQKSAIALSRLCCDPVIAKQVVALQGIQRLVRLCKNERERNGSDAVLVACLAVLRKVASACGFDKFKDLDAMELVEPRLLDTFLIYSSRQESFV